MNVNIHILQGSGSLIFTQSNKFAHFCLFNPSCGPIFVAFFSRVDVIWSSGTVSVTLKKIHLSTLTSATLWPCFVYRPVQLSLTDCRILQFLRIKSSSFYWKSAKSHLIVSQRVLHNHRENQRRVLSVSLLSFWDKDYLPITKTPSIHPSIHFLQ